MNATQLRNGSLGGWLPASRHHHALAAMPCAPAAAARPRANGDADLAVVAVSTGDAKRGMGWIATSYTAFPACTARRLERHLT